MRLNLKSRPKIYFLLFVAMIAVVTFFGAKAAYAAIYERMDGTCYSDESGRFPWNYTCSFNGDDYTNIHISDNNGRPGAGTESNPIVVPAGSSINVSTRYLARTNARVSNFDAFNCFLGSSCPTNIHMFTTVDMQDVMGSVDPGGGVLRECPSGADPIQPIAESPYAPANSSQPPGVNCGSQGKMVVWSNLPNGARWNERFLTVNLSGHVPVNEDQGRFCLRTNVAVAPAGMSTASPEYQALKRITKKSQKLCYRVIPVRISGNIAGDPTSSTGMVLPGAAVNFKRNGDCNDPAGFSTVYTNADGNYSFFGTARERICVRPPNPLASSDGTGRIWGTRYQNPYSINTGPDFTPNGDVINVDFRYHPVVENPPLTKVVDVGNGSSVKPGDQLTYTISGVNNIDSNSAGMSIVDQIPPNIDPASVSIVAASLGNSASAPVLPNNFRWTSNYYGTSLTPACTVGPAFGSITYGWQISGLLPAPRGTGFTCAVSSATNSIGLNFDRMPAFSQFSITWRGTVKRAPDIGFDSRTATATTPNGLQGVYNIVSAAAPGGGAPTSAAVYNPIPGDLCIAKSAYIESTDATGSSSEYCETEYQNEYLYDPSPTEPKYNEAIIKLHINPDENKGPVNYYVRDPSSGQLNPKISDVSTGDCTPDSNGVCGPRTVSWGSTASVNNHQRWPYVYNPSVATTTNDYDFRAKLRNDPSAPEGVGVNAVGQTFTNQASACIIQTWIAGWPVDCRPSNAITFKLIDVRRPFVTSEQGDIYAGGRSGREACSIDGTTPSPIVNGIRNNPGGLGWYMVTAPGGSISGFDSLAGYNGGVPVCRPDVEKAIDNLISKQPGIRITTGSSSYAPGTSDAANTGKILEISGDFTIGDADTAADIVEISRRWTIYVNGNLNIRDNIQYQDGTSSLTAAGSLGVVATGDINIAPWVTRLDGAYYAKGKINTCATAGPFKTLSYRVGTTTYPGYTPTECGQQLTINGVVLANSFRYNRTAQQAAGSYGEIAKLTDRLFLATPPGFSDLALQFNPAIYQGERRPRY